MAKRKIGPLSYADLVKTFKEECRFDHPGRRSIVFGAPKSELPRCYRRIVPESLYVFKSTHGEFIPNPPGCVGIRKLPDDMKVELVERMKAARVAGEAHPASWESKEGNDELLATSQD